VEGPLVARRRRTPKEEEAQKNQSRRSPEESQKNQPRRSQEESVQKKPRRIPEESAQKKPRRSPTKPKQKKPWVVSVVVVVDLCTFKAAQVFVIFGFLGFFFLTLKLNK
jgi:hypothetical protein